MVSIILLLLLSFGFLMGLKRGFVLQVFHLIGFIASFFVAVKYYSQLAAKLSLWIPYPELSNDGGWAVFLKSLPLENAFYNAVSFALIFFSVKVILQIIASMLDFVAELPLISIINRLFGSILGFLEIYLILFIVLFILALTPLSKIQAWIFDSSVAIFMIEKTPILSKMMMELWFIS